MPYITNEQREIVDGKIDQLVGSLETIADEDIEGVMNYTITQLLCKRMKPGKFWRYKWINRTIGVLVCIKDEFQRRITAEYENYAIKKNGDIDVYKEPSHE